MVGPLAKRLRESSLLDRFSKEEAKEEIYDEVSVAYIKDGVMNIKRR